MEDLRAFDRVAIEQIGVRALRADLAADDDQGPGAREREPDEQDATALYRERSCMTCSCFGISICPMSARSSKLTGSGASTIGFSKRESRL